MSQTQQPYLQNAPQGGIRLAFGRRKSRSRRFLPQSIGVPSPPAAWICHPATCERAALHKRCQYATEPPVFDIASGTDFPVTRKLAARLLHISVRELEHSFGFSHAACSARFDDFLQRCYRHTVNLKQSSLPVHHESHIRPAEETNAHAEEQGEDHHFLFSLSGITRLCR